MKRGMALAVVICLGTLLTAELAKPGVLSADEVRKVVPTVYFFRGQSASVQLRNSAGFSVPQGKLSWPDWWIRRAMPPTCRRSIRDF